MFNPTIHNRQSRRLRGYDYASEGLYFITLSAENRGILFGNVINGEMVLNAVGNIAHDFWLDIPNHYPHIELHEFVVMPDHIHGILEIKCYPFSNAVVGANNYSPLLQHSAEFKSPSRTIGSVIRGYKIGVTKWMREHTDVHDVWQRNYYDCIIRDYEGYHRICTYIRDNPRNYDHGRGE